MFNSAYVLADPSTATDSNYEQILGVIAHEYFHNWTGNRVTVRDWFQLTLKEGLTVFRDQWFSSDVTSHAVKRIEDVRGLRSRQFAEDSGPMAHPIRPESYISMDNFYTGTVYIKGAEIVRMYRTILGDEGFKKGMKLYFERHDGSAVTCDDFLAAMSDANGFDLTQFQRWYSQAGTPEVDIKEFYDEERKVYTLEMTQRTPSTPGQPAESKLPLMIPIVTGLLSRKNGEELAPSKVLLLTEEKQTFSFEGISERPLASILRDFSAPVKIKFPLSSEDLAILMAHDKDSFNRWEAGNQLSSSLILELSKLPVEDIAKKPLPESYISAVKASLSSWKTCNQDLSLLAYALQLPDISTLAQEMEVINPDTLFAARNHVKRSIAQQMKTELMEIYEGTSQEEGKDYVFSPSEVSRRRLRNTCLDFLTSLNSPESTQLSYAQFTSANCMSDKLAALSCLVSSSSSEGQDLREKALEKFYADANGDALVCSFFLSFLHD